MSKKENMVVKYAVRWWVSRRPRDWTREQHLSNPTVTCVKPSDFNMAKAVAKFLDHASNANQLLNEAESDVW